MTCSLFNHSQGLFGKGKATAVAVVDGQAQMEADTRMHRIYYNNLFILIS